ncbi:hypothetical protein NP233_g7289 [Leucocoprinus birnbaumii]|uniref:F-box domain-containing protein n=1 Tax=Leucocoprinus birnbaumii TaxID=56174 RepID=A0AAD5VUY8_9AGAR|nr:hypothetical protein NP233_g7289 [Leucocoprinus birnbaumii]
MPGELATWADLPVEILDQIIGLCDTPALLTLSYLNTQLNTLALETLFKRENVTSPKLGYIVSRLARPEIVPALNAALWLTHLPHVTYYLNPDVERLFFEVRGLQRLVGRFRQNDRLDLYFSSVDRWFADTGSRRKSGGQMWIEQETWRTIFLRLLRTALNKGCNSMRVEGAHKLQTYYLADQLGDAIQRNVTVNAIVASPPLRVSAPSSSGTAPSSAMLADEMAGARILTPPSRPSIKKRLVRWVKKRLGLKVPSRNSLITGASTSLTPIIHTIPTKPIATPILEAQPLNSALEDTARTLFQTSNPCLKTLNLRSSMMFQPLFFAHTLDLISAHSSTIATLQLVSIKAPQDVWDTLFQTINLPAIQRFVYLYDTLIVEEPLVTPTLLLQFFKRHPSLQIVELYGVDVGDQDKSTEVAFPSVEEGTLPNLGRLDAHPKIISWLLQWPKASPKLDHVCLTSEYMATRLITTIPHFHPYDAFDTGLLALSSLLTPDTPFPPDPIYANTPADLRPIHLQLKFSTENMLLEWFLSHTSTNDTNQGQSVLQLLTNIRRLTISAHYHTRFESEHKQVIPRFLGMFPSLKELELTELPYPDEIQEPGFIEDVKKQVKTLERFVIGRDVVWDVNGVEGSILDECWD